MKILFIGPQGSGKTTQARLLAEHLGVPFISFGALLRERAKQDSKEGRDLRKDMEKGKLVDDAIAAKVMKQRVQMDDCSNGFVSDGYARSLHQISLFDPMFDLVLYLDVSDEQILSRLLKRATQEGRFDDTPEAIKIRLLNYHKFTEPVLEKYKHDGILKIIPGIGSVDKIQTDLREAISEVSG